MGVNAWLSCNLINHLNKCRGKSFRGMLKREGREAATLASGVDDEEEVVMRAFVDGEKIVRIERGDDRVVASILTKHGLSLRIWQPY